MYYVNSVSVYPSSVSLSVGEWYYYAYAVVDDPCGCSGVSWSSGNSSVATVNSSSGYIYAKAPGTAKIYATATDGSGKRDYLTVTVTSGNVCVSSVSLSEISLNMQKDSCHQLYAYIAPSNATNKSVTWSSNNTAVATVDSNGRVTAVSAGYAVITVKANDGSDERAWCYVTVTGNVLATSVTMSETCITLKAGQSQDLNAQICPENVTATCIAWSSSDTNIVTVNPDSGMVYAKSQGTAYVYAITVDGSGVFGSCFVTVEPLIPIECVSICPDSMTMNVCESSRLTATVCPGDADDKRVIWHSSDEDVVCVDSDGNVYANCDGTATITAISVSDNSKYGTCTITVNPLKKVNYIAVRPDKKTMAVGENTVLKCNVLPIDAANKKVKWLSSNTNIACVDEDGRVYANSIGVATIYAIALDGSEVRGSCILSVETIPAVTVISCARDSWVTSSNTMGRELAEAVGGDGEICVKCPTDVDEFRNCWDAAGEFVVIHTHGAEDGLYGEDAEGTKPRIISLDFIKNTVRNERIRFVICTACYSANGVDYDNVARALSENINPNGIVLANRYTVVDTGDIPQGFRAIDGKDGWVAYRDGKSIRLPVSITMQKAYDIYKLF